MGEAVWCFPPDRPTVDRALDDGPAVVDGAGHCISGKLNRATDHPSNDTGENLFQSASAAHHGLAVDVLWYNSQITLCAATLLIMSRDAWLFYASIGWCVVLTGALLSSMLESRWSCSMFLSSSLHFSQVDAQLAHANCSLN